MGSRRRLKKNQRQPFFQSLSQKYRNIGLPFKAGIGALVLGLIALIAWRITGTITPTVAITAAGVVVGIHLLLTYLSWTKVIIISVLAASSVPQVAIYYLNLDEYSLITSMLILSVGGAFIGILGYRYARGRYWITLALSLTLLLFSGAAISVLIENYNAIFIGIGLAALFVVLRSIKWRKQPATDISDPSKNRKQALRDTSFSTEGKLLLPPDEVEEYDALYFTKSLRVGVLHRVKFSAGISRGQKGLAVGGDRNIDDLLAQKLIISQAIERKYKLPTVATILVVNDPGLRSTNITLEVKSKENNLLGKVILMHPTRLRQNLVGTVNSNSGLVDETALYSLVSEFETPKKELVDADAH